MKRGFESSLLLLISMPSFLPLGEKGRAFLRRFCKRFYFRLMVLIFMNALGHITQGFQPLTELGSNLGYISSGRAF